MNNDHYPKILFLNINFRYDNSAGLTASKLFSFLPRKNCSLLSVNADKSNINMFEHKFQICRKNSNLNIKSTNYKKNRSELKTNNTVHNIALLGKKVFRVIIGNISKEPKFEVSINLKEWLFSISPDYIYLNPENISNIKLALEISKLLNCKIIIHILDDKVKSYYPGLLGLFRHIRFKKNIKKIIKHSDIRLSISKKMAREYKKRYNEIFHPFHNPIVEAKWKLYTKNDYTLNRNINILYSGFIGATAKPILTFCEAINYLSKENLNISLSLYSKFYDYATVKQLEKYSFVKIYDYVKQSELPAKISSADLLLLPLPFDKKTKFTSLSMPTKTAEYMISGVPVIVFAPIDTAIAEYATHNKWGYVIGNNSKEEIIKGIFDLINHKDIREELSKNAISLARKNHAIEKNQLKLIQILKATN